MSIRRDASPLAGNSFTDLVVKFGLAMPPKMVLAAIDEILSQDKNQAEDQLNITVGGDGGTASFASRYEYDLFAVLPVVRQLDESRAKQLLEENQTLQSKLQQYPQGLNSLDPPPPPERRRTPITLVAASAQWSAWVTALAQADQGSPVLPLRPT